MTLTGEQLRLLDETKEVHVRTRSGDRTIDTIIWIVVIDGTVYVRSVKGEAGHWYQRALADPRVDILVGNERIPFEAVHVDDEDEIEAVSDALRAKYNPGVSLDNMTDASVLNTTLRLEPAS